MSQEIKTFDATEALKSVKERIKDSFVSLIPEAQWNEMVKKEVDKQEERYINTNYSSNFTKDVHSVLQEEVKERIKEYLAANFSDIWYDNGIPICNSKVEEMITKNAGKILTDLIGGTIQMAIQNAGYRM